MFIFNTFIQDEVFLKVGKPPTKSFQFLKDSLFASYLIEDEVQEVARELSAPSDVKNESFGAEEIKVSDIRNFEENMPADKVARLKSKDMPYEEIEDMYGGMFLNYYYELFLPDLNNMENIFLYPPDMDKPVC